MKATMHKLGWRLAAVAALAVFGCGETTAPEPAAPVLPPAQSMSLDLGFFSNSQAPKSAETAGTRLNFFNAAVRAAFINVAVVTVLTPPHLAFAAALHTIPSRQEDGSYLWIYTWVDQGKDYQIRLRGRADGDHVDWELSVVLPGVAPGLWFSGRSEIGRDHGYWIFRDFTLDGDPELLRIDWDVQSATDVSLNLRNIHAGQAEEGDELRYRVGGPDHAIEFHDASTNEDWDILWNAANGTGSLRVPDYNQGERACWDTHQEDTTCPPAAAAGLAASR